MKTKFAFLLFASSMLASCSGTSTTTTELADTTQSANVHITDSNGNRVIVKQGADIVIDGGTFERLSDDTLTMGRWAVSPSEKDDVIREQHSVIMKQMDQIDVLKKIISKQDRIIDKQEQTLKIDRAETVHIGDNKW